MEWFLFSGDSKKNRKMAFNDTETSARTFISDSVSNRYSALKCILFCYFLANKPIWNETYADALKRDLLMSYDKFARPTQHYNTTKGSGNGFVILNIIASIHALRIARRTLTHSL